MDIKFREKIFNNKYIGTIKNSTIIYEYKSKQCSDNFKIFIKIKDNKIIDIKYQIFGCIGLMAGCFQTCDLIINKTISEVFELKEEDILKDIGVYPEEKKYCILKLFNLFNEIFVDFV